MNLSLGEIELNDISFGMDTSMDEVLGNSQFHSYVNGRVGIFTSELVEVEGYTFHAKIIFIDKHINKIQLIPVNLEMEDPGYPDEKYQQEKKKVTDSFLLANLGKPLKETEAVLYYGFGWGNISSVAFLSGRNEYTGGFVEISYRK